jgi:hypothetical protein
MSSVVIARNSVFPCWPEYIHGWYIPSPLSSFHYDLTPLLVVCIVHRGCVASGSVVTPLEQFELTVLQALDYLGRRVWPVDSALAVLEGVPLGGPEPYPRSTRSGPSPHPQLHGGPSEVSASSVVRSWLSLLSSAS